MSQPGHHPLPTAYRLKVDGHLGDHWRSSFEGFTMTHETDGTTTMVGDVADQAQLHGLLARVRDLGVTLLSVDVLPPASRASSVATGGRDPVV